MTKKKIYRIVWMDNWGVYYTDLIRAKDSYHAWKKLKRRNPFITISLLSLDRWEAEDL